MAGNNNKHLRTGRRPKFAELPLDPSYPAHAAWGIYGLDDELGTLNLLTPERTVAAAKEIQTGTRIGLNWGLEHMDYTGGFREILKHEILQIGQNCNDDRLEFNTQTSSQWDGLRHWGFDDGRFYNGLTQSEILDRENSTLGIHGMHLMEPGRHRGPRGALGLRSVCGADGHRVRPGALPRDPLGDDPADGGGESRRVSHGGYRASTHRQVIPFVRGLNTYSRRGRVHDGVPTDGPGSERRNHGRAPIPISGNGGLARSRRLALGHGDRSRGGRLSWLRELAADQACDASDPAGGIGPAYWGDVCSG
ncbi:hypothetical protein BP5796_05505 [Coleophoma crateriformis]|uniref:Uncharacterized protein n=1 Tax=Coleophoma crateriformis TaxID=565419 RepID=A0A3D8S3C1_9HELO|nr:hypothetical protein BP5796_05505 [Coleophoma crateriformis]